MNTSSYVVIVISILIGQYLEHTNVEIGFRLT